MTDRQYFSLRRASGSGLDVSRAEGGPWRCRRSSDWATRSADVRREDVLLELLDEAHARIRELEAALERAMARSL